MNTNSSSVAWVTGAGSGLGQAAAISLARAGFDLILSGRQRESLEKTEELVTAAGGKATLWVLDVSNEDDVQRFGRWLSDSEISLNTIVCNAGFNVQSRRWRSLAMTDFAAIVETNLTGTARCASLAIDNMRGGTGGTIIVVSSWIAWRNSEIAGPAYAASKTALGALVESINMEEGSSGIRATHLCPSEVVTPILMSRPTPPSKEDLSKMLQPEDVGTMVSMIASLPPEVCVNELVMSHISNRMYEPH